MQELKSISTCRELSSEIVEKDLRGATYDPHQEALFAVLQKNQANRSSTLERISEASVQRVETHSYQPEEEKSKEHSTQYLRSLASLRDEKRSIELEANPKGEPSYLMPYFIAESRSGKQIFTTDTYFEPDCLRFCPSNSSDKIEISLSGTIIFSIHNLTIFLGFTVKAKAQSQTARTNKGFSEGVHYWEIICPISCSTLQIGVSNKNQKEEVVQQFRTTTPRIIGVELNIEKQSLNFWLNGRFIKERYKKIGPNQQWYPTVKFKEPDYFVVINPFAQGRGIQEEINTNYLPKVPQHLLLTYLQSLQTNEDQLFIQYITTQLKGILVSYGLNQQYTNEQEQDLRKLIRLEDEDYLKVKLLYKESDSQEAKINFAILQFSDDLEAIKYYHKNKDLKLLHPRQIAALIYGKSDKLQPQAPEFPYELGADLKQCLTSKVFTDEKGSEFLIFSGLSNNTSQDQLGQRIINLQDSIEQNQIGTINNSTHDKEQDQTDLLYLENSDKLLLVNGSELKLVSRSKGDFDLENQNFTCYPKNPEDRVRLELSLQNLQFILRNLEFSLLPQKSNDIVSHFLSTCQESYTHSHVLLPYNVALIVVKLLLNVAIQQYEQIEESFTEVQEQEIIHKPGQKIPKEESKESQNLVKNVQTSKLTIVDAHQLLSLMLSLEDQLWSMIQSDQVSSSVKDLWDNSSSRIHTSYGRLSSLVTFPVKFTSQYGVDQVSLAEFGIINIDDKYGKLQHFQEFRVELENVFQNQRLTKNDLQQSLERQFPNNLLLKGFPTWNVPLSNTLNHLPPSVHENALSDKKNVKPLRIEKVSTLKGSDFVMTTARDGSINIWNTKTQLHCVGQYNFKSKLYQEEDVDIYNHLLASVIQHEEEKKDSGDVKLIIKKAKSMQALPKQEAEDILYTMFDESENVEDIEEELPSLVDEEHISEFIYDFFEAPSQQQKAKKEKPEEEEKKEEVKEKDKEEVKEGEESDKPIEPSQDLLNQMLMMGFPIEFSKKALIQVKNESLTLALDALMEIQSQQPQKPAEQNIKIVSYNCIMCTFNNPEGKAVCEMCGTAAPETAYVFVKNEEQEKKEKEEAERKRKQEEDEILRQIEIAKKKEEEERIRREKEEEEKRLKEELKLKTKLYYENSEIVDYLFAQFNGGRDAKPLLSACIMKNKEKSTHDIEIVRFGYHYQYLKQFIGTHALPRCSVCDIPFQNSEKALDHVFELHRALLEGLYPIFVGSQLLTHKWNPRINRHQFHTLKSENLATIILPFEHLDFICQVGSDITPQTPVYIIGAGRKAGSQEQTVVIEKIEYTQHQELKITNLTQNSQLFRQTGIIGEINKLWYCQSSDRVIVQSSTQDIGVFKIDRENDALHLIRVGQFFLEQESSILRVENGIIYVKTRGNKVRRYLIDEKTIDQTKQRHQLKQQHSESKLKEAIQEADILQMQIDPEKVTIQDIQRYEKLMNGKTINAISNASSQQCSETEGKNQIFFTKHHWVVNSDQQAKPLDIEFQNPTSLISLNVELTFNCKDIQQLVDSFTHVEQPMSEKVNEQTSQIDTSTQSQQYHEQNIMNLGLLSLHGTTTDSGTVLQSAQQNQENQQKQNQYMPLVVNHHKGSAYNQSYQVCRVVTDNALIFASNYPRPEFYFKHQHGHRMNIDKFTVRSNATSKCGAYPIGSGIIFISDNLSSFEKSQPFHKFTLSDYNDWKQERMKDPTPLKPWEPVAYFEFDLDTSITFDIDFQRSCKYILLKPTGFRKKPTAFTQNMNNVPLEIEFFGITGTSVEDSSSQSNDQDQFNSLSLPNNIFSNYQVELQVINEERILKHVNNIEIQSIQGFDQLLSGKVLSHNIKDLSQLKLIGKTTLKISDSHLQLQEVQGLSLRFEGINNELWQLRGVSIQGVVAEQDQSISSAQNALFGKPEIPLSYMRSCLLSPKYYNVVNRVLTQIISSDSHSQQLRLIVVQFLNKILKIDRDFIGLIIKDINLLDFIKLNLFQGDTNGIQLIIEFLQNFQRDSEFCYSLYNILLDYVRTIPENFISYHGYEALVGLLKWSIPINPEKTLQHLIDTLYQKICLQKIGPLQSKEYINFRSRQPFHTFPFDTMIFKSPKQQGQSKKEEGVILGSQAELISKAVLPAKPIRRLKYDTHHIYEVNFSDEMLVTDLKLYFANMETIQFKLIVKIIGEKGEMVYFNTFDEQIFAQFASMIYQKPASNNSSDDALHLTNLNNRGKFFTVVIEFGQSNSSIPRGAQKTKAPDTIIEVFGQPGDLAQLSHQSLKEMLDKNAQEYWQSSAKLVSVGKSMQMLQITKDSQETHYVPQGNNNQIPPPQAVVQNAQKEDGKQAEIDQLSQSKRSELELLQEELKGKIRANDSNIKEIVDKISNIQAALLNQGYEIQQDVIPSLEYYMQITSDFTKLSRSIIKSQKVSAEKVSKILRSDSNNDLSTVCFELFKRFVVYDAGQTKQDVLNFIVEVVIPQMTSDEYQSFTFKVIEEFLSMPQQTFSQRAVLESLSILGIPEGELISFLISKLNIGQKEKKVIVGQSQIQPFVLMSSVLILALNSLKQISIPEPGQAIHKGVPCTGCNAKFITGWRYKCGSCNKDVNFDEKCAGAHLTQNPHHILLIIQEPLPYNPSVSAKVQKQTKPILPLFSFKDGTEEIPTHDDVSCENCGSKPIQGTLYKCANCEDFSLCEKCYLDSKYEHFSYHIFMKFVKPLKQLEKNPTTLLQVLDPRLYSASQASKALDQISPTKKKPQPVQNAEADDEDDFEDLAPLNMGRSLSMPMNQKQKDSSIKQKNIQSQQEYEKLDYDQQFVVLFHTCVWICQDPNKSFAKEEKIVLLKLTIDTMLQLIKLTSVKHINEVVSNKEAFFQLLISILQLNSSDLLSLFKNLMDLIRQPPSLSRKFKEEQLNQKLKQPALSSEKKQQLIQEQKLMKQVLETLISHVQHFLKWLIDLGLNPDMAKLQALQGEDSWSTLLQNYTNQRIWLEQLSIILELFIKSTDELKSYLKNQEKASGLENIPEEQQEDGDDDLAPLSMARSISVPVSKNQASQQEQTQKISLQLIKSLVQLLYINDQAQNQPKMKQFHFKETESQTKYLSQMWALVLKSLTAVSINQLIEAKIFDSLVNAFLISTEEIKQITYPQILLITETIATQSVHNSDISKFICNLLFITLENVTNNNHEKVGYSICQGWLDILISSSIVRNPTYEQNKTVFAKMNPEEISVFLKKTSQYLINYLNKCSFEGVTGANLETVMRLNLASDLIYVIRYAESKNKPGTLAIHELFSSIGTNPKLKKDYQESIGNILGWLFLNARQARDDTITSQLGNSSTLNPATAKVKQITEHIEEIFTVLGDSDNNEQAVKIALQSMTSIVKKMNKSLLDLSQNNQIGFDLSVRLSERTNEYFIKLLGQWLVSDSVASYFVFDLGGFEFLLDTIGVGSESESKRRLSDVGDFEVIDHDDEKVVSKPEATIVQESDQMSAFQILQGSDLASYLESNLQEFQQLQQPKPVAAESEENKVSAYDKTNPVYVQEYSKSMVMEDNNGGDVVATHAKTDWSVNKRAYKHRIIVKHLIGALRPEYWILFSLPHPVELREVQIAFNNYWGADTEVYSEPLSVLVEAGLDKNNLSLVCNLSLAKDDAFGSVSATVFGSNLQSFPVSSSQEVSATIEDLIQQKLQSVQNFKVQYIKFRMRRHILTCLENSPLSTKFTKQPAFGINYISLLGFDMTKVGEYLGYIRQEQKKTALEVISIICSGDFASILKVIANQPQTIEKMKKSFNLLASLVSIKQNLIEPTFIAISTYNTEMGDWIINQFLKSGRNYKHASLVGEIIMSNKTELPRRLNLLKDHVMSSLRSITQEERSTHGTLIKKLLPFIQIFIQTLRIASPELEENQIDINIKETYLTDIVHLLSSATQEREHQTKILIQLLVLLLCPPSPFVNNNIDVYEFTVKHLIDDQSTHSSDEISQQKENLASILSSTQSQIAIEILNRGLKLDKLLNPGKGNAVSDDEKVSNTHLQHCIKFWINVSQDQEVKSRLASDKIPLKLYEILRQENPEQNNKIIRKDSVINEQELYLMIELIKYLTSGIQSLEGELSESLMKDLEYLSKIRDMNFVNKVFLQLLRIEKTLPICLWPYDSENKKWLYSYKPQIQSDQATQNSFSHTNFIPSQLLQGEKRSALIKNFKEIVGHHNKGTSKKLLSATWTLAHTQTEQQGQVSHFQQLWKNLENKSPVVLLMSGTNANQQNVVFGCYCAKGIPAYPTNIAQDSDYPVQSSPEDFVFCYIDDNSFHHFAPKQSVSIISMFTDYEGGGAISVANDFMLMPYSYDFVFTVGILYDLEKIQEGSNPKADKEVENALTFSKFEIWIPNLKDVQNVQAASQNQQKAKASNQSQLEASITQEVKHPWFNQLSPFINYRTNPVFMIPAHLSLGQLSKIMLESNVFFKTRFLNQLQQSSETLEELYQNLYKSDSLKKTNGIIDLEYEVNQLLNVQAQAEEVKEGEDLNAASDSASSSQMMSGYVPKMGLFEQFETQGGVKLIIQVTLQSMKLWKTEEQAKSWELWLKELESFSEIPLFFQLFLKNTRCKDLLFKVLAGLPDTEINNEGAKSTEAKTKWEEEQKLAVQFNYKILSEAFSISNDLKLRETAMKCGLLPRILDRLGQISGEKPRTWDDNEEQKEEESKNQFVQSKDQKKEEEKNVEKRKRKGVGYSSKVGQTFNVTAYLENKKLRNDQIKNLVDICSNFINCRDWKPSEEVLNIVLESALLPLLESAFRNGSWLDMAKESEVYHSYLGKDQSPLILYLALTRALSSQKDLIPCLVEIDSRYKPTQTDPIYRLLQKLNDLAEIFINCLNQQQKSEQEKALQKPKNDFLKVPEPLFKLPPLLPNYMVNPFPQFIPPSSTPPALDQFQSAEPLTPTMNNKLPNIMNLLQSSYNHKIASSLPDSDSQDSKSDDLSKLLQPIPKLNPYESPSLTIPKVYLPPPQTNQFNYPIIKTPLMQYKFVDEIDQMQNKMNDGSLDSDSDPSLEELKTLDQAQEEAIILKKLSEQNNQLTQLVSKFDAFGSKSASSKKSSLIEDKPSQKQPSIGSSPKASEDKEGSSSGEYETISQESLVSDKDDESEEDIEEEKKKTLNQKLKQLNEKVKKINEAKQHQIMESNYILHKKTKLSHQLKSKKSLQIKKKFKKIVDSDDSEESEITSSYSSEKSKKKAKAKDSASHSEEYDEDYDNEDDSQEDNDSGPSGSSSGSSSSSPEDSHLPSGVDSSYDTESEQTYNSEDERKDNQFQIEMDSEIPENLARDVIKTYKIVWAAVQKQLKNKKDDKFVENALHLPLPQAYKVLLQDLRFDYMDMKDPNDQSGTHYKHHYHSIALQMQNPPPSKMVRLAQELADLSNALPSDHTNAIFVRVDQQRVDMMKALICGASNTPYAHGCFEYDIFCDNNYPREPPKMNLITTGNGGVRFNPNLYACGKVCLSLLGTWRGSATENWDPKLSTILQVLLSTQAIIMSEEVYFNEPGFENEAGTPEGEKKNEGYQNIVRYCNIKFAMLEQIKRPSRGFESVIKRHFYLKKEEILKEVHTWVEMSEKNEASYSGLVNDHNYNWANQFKQSKNKYKEMLAVLVGQLEDELNKLEKPTDYELQLHSQQNKKAQQKKKKRQAITEGKAELGEIDMESDEEETQINTESKKEINIDDEAVKDRWSRYIGAMGVEAVAKQSAANIFLSGAGALGIEIAKNLVLAGCKTFTLHDYKPISYRDLSGQFFLNLEEDLLNEKKKKATRGEACIHRLKQLNYYVKCNLAQPVQLPLDEATLENEPWNFKMYDVIILTEATYDEIISINEYCRKHGKKFISADAYGVFTRVFNDFGEKFEVLDKNGEDLQDVMIKDITNEEEGVVELLQNAKHKFEDGDEVTFTQVEGMKLLPGEKHDDELFKSDSINETIHKVKVLTPYSFKIGNTKKFSNYERGGLAKQLKTKKIMNFKSFNECMVKSDAELPLDGNLSIADFEKMQNNILSHIAFEALDVFRNANKQLPGVWNKEHADQFISTASEISKRYGLKPEEWKDDSFEKRFFYLFSFTCQGVFNPLTAFQGGFIAQECVKAITQKFSPVSQVFYYDAFEVLPEFDIQKHLIGEGQNNQENYFEEKYVTEIIKTKEIGHRSDGLRIIVGQELVERLAYTRLFMVGAGAIGCELLKNFAMLGVGTGKAQPNKKIQGGSIVLTDPDVIEVSNLNRQFLFREKHLRKPKSSTAAAAAIYMNKELKENIIARLDKVYEGSAHIFTDQFFEELTVVTNALDNLHARRYIDVRCVTAKTPLLESGTLGPKGHVQVILPYKTESYGSMNDPEDNTEIPHCTLKMFPEETLHCVEWARDKFGKIFTSGPANTQKLLEEGEAFNPSSQDDTKSLKEVVKLLEKRPKTFEDCIAYARLKFEKFFNHDIKQLLHVYPLNAKTKDGNLFWSLPKRPPMPTEFDPQNILHSQFVSSMACLRANVFKIEIPSKTPRTDEFRRQCGEMALKVVVPEFVPDDEKAKEIQASVNKEVKEEEKKEGEESKIVEEELKIDPNDLEHLMKKFKQVTSDLPIKKGQIDQFIAPEQFEKDNDQNFHIDFIYSMANCRSTNYKLDPMDWITVKLKAGRIVPALATTTAAIAGLQTLELVKLLKNCKKTDHRNVFLNLAVPIMQASEPGDVIKTKLTENIEATLWDRWDIKKGKDIKLAEVINYIQETYKGLEVRDVMKGNAPLYFHAIMNAPGKEQEKEKTLGGKITELVGADSDDKYVDLNVTCIRQGDMEEKILSGVPPVRVFFE